MNKWLKSLKVGMLEGVRVEGGDSWGVGRLGSWVGRLQRLEGGKARGLEGWSVERFGEGRVGWFEC